MKTRIIEFFIILTFMLVSCPAFSQPDKNPKDTVTHSPRKATIYSSVLPGLGQAYNKKYWKIPVIYTAFGVTGYFFADNRQQYRIYKEAFRFRTDGNPDTVDPFTDIYTEENLKVIRDFYRRNLELNVIIGFAIYALNIIDAAVDAHLFDFDVSDDVSLNIQPAISPSFGAGKEMYGIKFTLKF